MIAKTTDAGETWSIQFNSNGTSHLISVISAYLFYVSPPSSETFFFFFLFFFHAGSFYFNDISCYDADHCVAVGEGDGAVEPGNRIYATKNGGATWELLAEKQCHRA